MRLSGALALLVLVVLAAYAVPSGSASGRDCGASWVPLANAAAALAPPPVPVRCSGIRPGALFNGGCTANWVFENTTNGDRDLYIGTAGHCIGVGSRASIGGHGNVGTAVYSRLGGGKDFALVKIDEHLEGLVNPQMCHWGGPVKGFADGTMTEKLERTYVSFGNGWTWSHPALQAKRGLVLPLDGGVSFVGPVAPGDSGSPIMLSNGLAWGIVTHGLSANGSPGPYGQGTPVGYGMLEAGKALGIELRLVTAPLA